MAEQITKIEKNDIQPPEIKPGGTAIVLQRHEKYSRDRQADNAGSLLPEVIEDAKARDLEFFKEVLAQEDNDGAKTVVLFVSSPTEYAGKGHRSMETADIAMNAAKQAMEEVGIDPTSRIINLADRPKRHDKTDRDVRPMAHIEEPRIFDVPEYVDFLREKHGPENGLGNGISVKAWAMHEEDAEKEKRVELGAEGVYDVLDRTKKAVSVFERYSRLAHHKMPNTRLVIWATSHYDTISPLMKDATGTPFGEFLGVDYGGGVVMNIEPGSQDVSMEVQSHKIALNLGRTAVEQ